MIGLLRTICQVNFESICGQVVDDIIAMYTFHAQPSGKLPLSESTSVFDGF